MKKLIITLSFIAQVSFGQTIREGVSTNDIVNGRMEFSDNGNFLGVLIGGNQVKFFQSETNLLTTKVDLDGVKELYDIVFGTDNHCYVSGRTNSGFVIVDIDYSSNLQKEIISSKKQITGLAIARKEQLLFFSNEAGEVSAFNLTTKSVKWSLDAHGKDYALDLSYSREGKLLASSGADGRVVLINLEGKQQKEIKVSKSWVTEVMITQGGNIIVAGTETGEVYQIFGDANYAVEKIENVQLKGRIAEIVLAPDDNVFLAVASDGDVLVWSMKDQKALRSFKEGLTISPKGAAFNPNGKSIYVSSYGTRQLSKYDVSVLGIVPKFRFKDESDKTAPLVYISNPPNITEGQVTISESLLKIQGTAVDESGIYSMKINGIKTPIKENGSFSITLPLQMGENFFTVEVQDVNENITLKRFTVKRRDLLGESYDPKKSENYLFIVGINDYEYWPKLSNAVRDAEEVAETLIGMYDFSFSKVKMLLNEQASLNNIYTELRKYIEKIGPQDNLVIYYSGHGDYDDLLNEGYWVPYDAHVNAPGEYLSNSNLLKIINSINSQHTFMVVDACFSGSLFAATTRGYVDNVEKYRSRWGLASGRLETVSDGAYGENSPFEKSFIEFLKNNDKKEIPVSEIVQYVKVKVADGHNQTPIGNPIKGVGDEGGEFIFRKKE